MGLISDGTTVFDAGAMSAGLGGSMTLIKSITASGASSVSFMNGGSGVVFDGTYKEYLFIIKNWNPSSDNKNGEFSFSINGSNFGIAKTSTYFRAKHDEGGSANSLTYISSADLAQATGNQILCEQIGNGGDEHGCAMLTIYDPANTTFVKHFVGRTITMAHDNGCLGDYVAGYINTTSAVVGTKFECESGSAFDGIFTLYGIS